MFQHHPFLTHLPVDGLLGCFQPEAGRNSAEVTCLRPYLRRCPFLAPRCVDVNQSPVVGRAVHTKCPRKAVSKEGRLSVAPCFKAFREWPLGPVALSGRCGRIWGGGNIWRRRAAHLGLPCGSQEAKRISRKRLEVSYSLPGHPSPSPEIHFRHLPQLCHRPTVHSGL